MLIWAALVSLAIGILILFQREAQITALEKESAALQRLVSQRVGQHDAHMTSLSAIATAADQQRSDLFLGVAATISRFYPRIDEVQLVPLNAVDDIVGTRTLEPSTAAQIRQAALQSTGLPVVVPHPDREDHYMLVKRSPNTDDAVYALMIAIDAKKLVESDAEFWQRDATGIRLQSPEGIQFFSKGEAGTTNVASALASPSQPLLLETGLQIGIADLLTSAGVVGAMLIVSVGLFLVVSGYRQHTRARMAERAAALSKVDAQLAHASRVNIMGEMASGMAHELTQPLTAILAQAQVGKRLLSNGDLGALEPTLEATAVQAKRASAILERLRNWTRPSVDKSGPIDLRLALRNVTELLKSEADQRRARLNVDAPDKPVEVNADQIEMEQVFHNLIRNALDALEEQTEGNVTVSVSPLGDEVRIDIADNGPGVADDFIPSLFVPFMTNRDDGSGLGLALSQRLIERAGGEIALVSNQHRTKATEAGEIQSENHGAVFRVVLPLSNGPGKSES